MQPVVLFDGECGLCDQVVQFLLRADRRGRLRFAPLQGPFAQRALQQHGLTTQDLQSVVLLHHDRVFVRSEAALRIAMLLGLPWSLAAIGLLIPCPVRDAAYRWVARNRYRWFGKRDACRLPSPDERARFFA